MAPLKVAALYLIFYGAIAVVALGAIYSQPALALLALAVAVAVFIIACRVVDAEREAKKRQQATGADQ